MGKWTYILPFKLVVFALTMTLVASPYSRADDDDGEDGEEDDDSTICVSLKLES